MKIDYRNVLPLRQTSRPRHTYDYKRHRTTTLFAAFNILNGKVIGVACRGVAVRSSSSSSINWKRRRGPALAPASETRRFPFRAGQ